MAKLKIGDLVYVKPPIPGSPGGGSGIIRAISVGEETIRYLVEFEEGIKDWYPRGLVELLQSDQDQKPKRFVPQTEWSKNPELRESILDAWYELSPETFNQALEMFNSFGASMLEWLKDTNPELFKNAYIKGHEVIGVKVYYQVGEQ